MLLVPAFYTVCVRTLGNSCFFSSLWRHDTGCVTFVLLWSHPIINLVYPFVSKCCVLGSLFCFAVCVVDMECVCEMHERRKHLLLYG